MKDQSCTTTTFFKEFFCPILNPLNVREKVKAGKDKAINRPKLSIGMPHKSCRRKSAKAYTISGESHRV